jgi:hypothetical protein
MMASLRPERGASYNGVVAGVVDGCLCPPSRVNSPNRSILSWFCVGGTDCHVRNLSCDRGD